MVISRTNIVTNSKPTRAYRSASPRKLPLKDTLAKRIKLTNTFQPTRYNTVLGLSCAQKVALDSKNSPAAKYPKAPFTFRVQRMTNYGTWILLAHIGRRELALSFSTIMGKTFTLHNQDGLMRNIRFFDAVGNPIKVTNFNGLYMFKAGQTIQFDFEDQTYTWKNLSGDILKWDIA